MDAISAVLLDLTDDTANVLPGQTRDQRLVHVWNSYHEWSEAERHLGKNAQKKIWWLKTKFRIDSKTTTNIHRKIWKEDIAVVHA